MGSELYLHATVGGQDFVARVDSRFDFRPGAQVKLAPDLNKIHIFDAQTQEAVPFSS